MGKMTKLIMFVLLMVCAFLGGVFGGEVKEIIAAKDGVAEVIKARKFVLVNHDGKEMGAFAITDNKYPMIYLTHANGKPLFVAGSGKDFGSLLRLTGETGENQLAVQGDKQRDTRLILTGNTAQILMGTNENYKRINLSSYEGTGTGLFMSGSGGGNIVNITANEKNESAFALTGGSAISSDNLLLVQSTQQGIRISLREKSNRMKMTGDELIDKLEKIK